MARTPNSFFFGLPLSPTYCNTHQHLSLNISQMLTKKVTSNTAFASGWDLTKAPPKSFAIWSWTMLSNQKLFCLNRRLRPYLAWKQPEHNLKEDSCETEISQGQCFYHSFHLILWVWSLHKIINGSSLLILTFICNPCFLIHSSYIKDELISYHIWNIWITPFILSLNITSS